MDSQIGVDMKRPSGSKSYFCRRGRLFVQAAHKVGRVILVDRIRQRPRAMREITDIRPQDACIEIGCQRAMAIDICLPLTGPVDQVCLSCKPSKPFTG